MRPLVSLWRIMRLRVSYQGMALAVPKNGLKMKGALVSA